jgi:NitT/TauT family transport system permease protein
MSTLLNSDDIITGKPVPAARRGRLRHRVRVVAGQLALGLVFLAIWEAAVRLRLADPFIFGQPTKVFAFLLLEAIPGKELWVDTAFTMMATALAFVFGSLLGIACGLLLVEFRRAGDLFRPYITLLNSLPRVALAPLFIVWFGLGLTSKVVLGVSLVFFILLLNTMAGALAVDQDLVRLCRSLGASRWTIFRKITLPASAPSIFAGLKLGLVYSLLGVVVGEMIGAVHGLGMRVVLYSNLFEMNKVFALLLFLALLTTMLAQLMHALESYLLRWREEQVS